MNALSTTTSLLAHSLSWALLCSLCQGVFIYVFLFVLLKSLPGLSARIKYHLSYGAFTAITLWFADTWFNQYQKLKGTVIYITQLSAASGTTNTVPVTIAGNGNLQGTWLHTYLPDLERYVPLIMAIYICGLVFMLFRFVVNSRQIRTLRLQGLKECDPGYSNFVTYWQKQLGISRRVQLYLSDRINVPVMLGTLKPLILLPVATINHLTAEQVEAILLHELAHIKRHDYLLNILQTIAETVLFFNPFIWLISGIIRREREHCCDDMVISCSASPLPYAHALAILETNKINSKSLALAASGHKNLLLNRIKRIMEMKSINTNYSRVSTVLATIIAITFTIALFTFTPSWGQKAKDEQKSKDEQSDKGKKKNVYKTKIVTVDSNGKKTVKEYSSDKGGTKITEDDDNLEINIVSGDEEPHSGNKARIIIKKDGKECHGEELDKMVQDIVISTTNSAADAIATIDFAGISREIAEAGKEMDEIDWNKISADINSAMAELDKQLNDKKMHKEVKIRVRKELEHAQRELEKTRAEIDRNRAMADARAYNGHKQSHSNTNDYEAMLDKMEQDGLLNRKDKYKVEKKKNKLYINDTEQSDNVYHKYQNYLEGDNVIIRGSKDALTINVYGD